MTILQLPATPFSVRDLDVLGLTRKQLRGMLADGAVRPLLRGTYAAADLPDTLDLRAQAAALLLPPHHVVVDRTAAWIHGIDAYAYAELECVPPVETCALRGHTRTRLTGTAGGTRTLAPHDIAVVQGVSVTTPLRTSCDLGCRLRRREAYAAMCAFARRHAVTSAVLNAKVRRLGGRRGVIQLRELATLVDQRFESAREAWVFLAIHDAGLPHPVRQHWVEVDGVPTYRLDFAYVRARVCIEYDGVEAHLRTEEQIRRDAERRALLSANGWTVIVVRLGDFTDDAMDRWLRELRQALRPSYDPRRW